MTAITATIQAVIVLIGLVKGLSAIADNIFNSFTKRK